MYRVIQAAALFLFFTCVLKSQEVIDVADEPFHKTIFLCDEFRVIKLEMNPGDTSIFHIHSDPILYITIQGTKMWLDERAKGVRTADLPDNWIGSDAYSTSEPFEHRISVVGDKALILTAVIRYKTTQSEANCSSLYSENGFTVLNSEESCDGVQINIVKSGTCKTSAGTILPGDSFESVANILESSDDFDYYQVVF